MTGLLVIKYEFIKNNNIWNLIKIKDNEFKVNKIIFL